MRIDQKQIVTGADMSSGTITSESLPALHAAIGAVHAVFTGSPTGTIKIQSSIDGVNWTDITGSSRSITAAGDIMWNLNNIGFNYFRLVYIATSGTGTLNAWSNFKGF
jgi:hypothetical protein